jgi:hypothetical protein
MKVHFLFINRVACDENMPRNATFAINPALVTCQRCRKTKVFRSAQLQKKKQKSTHDQMEMFG